MHEIGTDFDFNHQSALMGGILFGGSILTAIATSEGDLVCLCGWWFEMLPLCTCSIFMSSTDIVILSQGDDGESGDVGQRGEPGDPGDIGMPGEPGDDGNDGPSVS